MATKVERHREALRGIPWWPIVLGMVVVAFLALHWQRTRLPGEVTIYGGPKHGRYDALARAIAKRLRSEYGIRVHVVSSKGSMANLQALEKGKADFALYQPGTRELLGEPVDSDSEPASFVANVYTEYVVPFGPDGDSLAELAGKTWACNDKLSGDYAACQMLLDHFGGDQDGLTIKAIPYGQMVPKLEEGSIDAGLVTTGLRAPIMRDLFSSNACVPLEVPYADALASKYPSLSPVSIPAGFFQTHPRPLPSQDFRTVGMRAQLLTGKHTSVRLVEEVTRIILDARFQRVHQLHELNSGGNEFAQKAPEFPIHIGASHIYHPEFKPILNPDFVEGTEGIRSFVVSMLAAGWLLYRWWKKREALSHEHRLDRYIHRLLELERRQLDFDARIGSDDSDELQDMLDEVTKLRQDALKEFTAHELNEDRAVECFMQMCHALSDKINAKLTRQTMILLLQQNDASGG